jgi:hypothetical protein
VRLTLRTLLAYLDDILPPAETKELGEKIATTPAASQLVDRIREVMRRRRLTAPEPDGSGGGIEPNLVAEYLDNNLAPERVADVERICLESDINLAEAAACHQILTLVLGEPVEISGRLRERMYALGPQGTPLAVPDGQAPSKNIRDTNAREQLAAIKSAQVPKTKTVVKKPESRVPEYLRRKPLWKRLLPWAAIAAVIAIWFGLLYGDPSLFRGSNDADTSNAVVAVVEGDGAKEVDQEPVEAPAEKNEVETAPQVAASELPDLPIDPEPPADDVPIMEEGSKAPEPAGEVVASTTTSDATKTAPEPAGPIKEPMPEPASNAKPATPAPAAPSGPPQIDIVASSGSVFRFEPTPSLWFPMADDEDPPVGVPIAVPEPFDAKITASGLGLGLSVLGGTRFTPIGSTDAAPIGFDLAQGRIRFAVPPGQQPKLEELMIGLRLGKGLWRIEALTPQTVFGIEALPLQPTGEGQDLSDRTPQGVVYVAEGTLRVADASGRVEVASAGNRLILTPAGNGIGTPPAPAEPSVEDEVTVAEPSPSSESASSDDAAGTATPAAADAAPPEPAEETPSVAEAVPADATPVGLPPWMIPREPTSAARRAMVAFQKEILAGVPISESLLPAVDSPYYFVAEPAAKALALVEDVDGMVKTLRSGGHEAMLAAIEGIRNWLGRSPRNAETLKRELDLVFAREGLSETLYLLLMGFNSEDAHDEIVAMQLVEWLDHPEPVVRELAFYHVKRLSGGLKMNYVPTHTAGQRAGAVKRWRDFVSRNGGLTLNP